jgi:hypothetical protein
MLHISTVVFIAASAFLIRNAHGIQEFNINIAPFQLELRSIFSIQTPQKASLDLINKTEYHLISYIKSINSDIWNGIQSISLYPEEVDTYNTNSNDEHNSRMLQSSNYFIFQVLYSGSMTFSHNNNNIYPSKEDISKAILDAFIGQGKIDYLRSLRVSDEMFLSFANYAKVWIPFDDTDAASAPSKEGSVFVIIAIVASVAVALSISIVVYYGFFYRGDEEPWILPSISKKRHSHSRSVCDKDKVKVTKSKPKCQYLQTDLWLTSTTSMSPPPDESPKERFSFDQQTQSESSFMSKNTIDVNSSYDRIGFQHKCANVKAPFDSDITMISTASPNKTIIVQPPREVGGRKSSSKTQLSKEVLNQHYARHLGKSYEYSSHRTGK